MGSSSIPSNDAQPATIMSTRDEQWTLIHDLALLFAALAYGTDHELDDSEVSAITQALQAWSPETPRASIREIIVEVMSVLIKDQQHVSVSESIATLGRELSEDQLSDVLAQVNHIAEADGILLQREEHLISNLAAAWSLRGLEGGDGLDGDWDLIHQMAFIYVVVAHSTDNELSSDEIAAIVERVREWDALLDDEDARDIVRDALAFYAQEPDEDILGQTIMTIKNSLAPMRRLILLDDLYYIAYADGTFNENERDMITSLAEAWGVSIRLNGHA
jgi:uncharacterized tellurite resistance protein B-like protein